MGLLALLTRKQDVAPSHIDLPKEPKKVESFVEKMERGYFKNVDSFFNWNRVATMYSSAPLFNQYILNKLVSSAKKDIKIFMSGEELAFYGKSLVFPNNVSIEAILDEPANRGERALLPSNTKYFVPNQFTQIRVDEDFFSEQFDSDYNPFKHFMIVDDKRYRIEKPHKTGIDFAKSRLESISCANSPKCCKLLSHIFEDIKTKSEHKYFA